MASPRRLASGDCVDTGDGATDPYGTGFWYYDANNPDDCGWFDDSGFSSGDM